MRDYLRAGDFAHLPENLIALHDDDTGKGERILISATRLWTVRSPAADGRQHYDKFPAMVVSHCCRAARVPARPGCSSAATWHNECIANQQLGMVLFGDVRGLRCHLEGSHGSFKEGRRAKFRSGPG